MENYTTEEQQVEAIKRFLSENGTSLIAGIVLGLGGLIGWQQYSAYQIETKEAASEAYTTAIGAVPGEEAKPEAAKLDAFVSENPESAYAVLAAFQSAKLAVEADDLGKAAEKLQFAADNISDPALKAVALTRLARVQLAVGDADKALSTLAQPMPKAFKAQIEEIKGDAFIAKGNKEKARMAYQAAADADGLEGNNILKLKLDDLAVAENI